MPYTHKLTYMTSMTLYVCMYKSCTHVPKSILEYTAYPIYMHKIYVNGSMYKI